MVENIYLFLIDYGKSLLLHPITNGFGLLFYIFLWQLIGIPIISVVRDLTEPLKMKLNMKVNYFVLVFGCLTGLFSSIYFLSGLEGENNVYDRAFRLIGIFGTVFLFLIPVTVILGAGIIIPIFSFTMWIVNGIISILPVLAGLAVLVPILFFGGIFSIVAGIAGRL